MFDCRIYQRGAQWHWQVMNDFEHVLASGVAESDQAARNAVVLQCLQRLGTIPDQINDLMELIRRRVSALGQKQTLRPRIVMSALPPIAEIGFVGTASRTSGLRRPFMQHHRGPS